MVHRVIPGGDAGEVADDLNFTYLGHLAKVVARQIAEQLDSVHGWHIEWRQLVCLLSRRRLFKYQPLVLADVGGGFLDLVIDTHYATSFAASSIETLVVVSVQHHKEALPNSG